MPAQRLLGMSDRDRAVGRAESNLVGRRWEMSAVEGLLERAIDGHGAVVSVVGSPGIGKSRWCARSPRWPLAAGCRGVHRLLRVAHQRGSLPCRGAAAAGGHRCRGLDGPAARERVRARVPDADPEDLLLFDDLLGIADPEWCCRRSIRMPGGGG